MNLRDLIEEATANEEQSAWPRPLDLAALAACEPERPRHIIDPWMPEGEVTLLAGHGGAGKSAIALHLAACIALGVPWCGIPTARRRVVYLSYEDRAEVIHWRLSRISHHVRVPLGELAGELRVLDASRGIAELMTDSREGASITAAYDWLAGEMREAQVLVLDGASDSYGSSEIVRRDVRRYIRALRQIIPADGAVLLLAHLDKAAARDGATGDRYSGSTAWHNSVRARWELRADGDGLALALAKANHAAAGAEIRLRWDPQAHMHLADARPADGGLVASIKARTEREGILAAMRACAAASIIVPAAMQGPRTAYHVLSARPELPESLRSGPHAARQFRARLEELRHIPAVMEREIRRSNRHSTVALVLADIGTAPNAPHSEN